MWKLGLNWTVTDAVRFRGTVSADTRAPSVLNLFNTASVTQGRNNVPSAAAVGAVRTSGQNVTTGNPGLKPEHARTYTAGFVFSPAFVPGFQASIDWYKIKILDSITTPGAQTLIDQCNAGDQASCKTIIVNGAPVTRTTGITATDFVVVTTMPINAPSGASNAGLDLATAYTHVAGSGKLSLRLNANYLLSVKDPTGCPLGSTPLNVTDIIGAIGGACGNYPRLTGRVSANYAIGRFDVGVTERYIDHGLKNPNYVVGVDITSNNVPSIAYTDLNLNYQIGKTFGGESSAFLNVTNTFDRDPPNTATSARSWVVPTEFGLYDVQGRRYTLGVRFKL
jgi:outer membrane receptor protein involved in Fe transport